MEKQYMNIIHYFNRTSLFEEMAQNDSRRLIWCDTFMTLESNLTQLDLTQLC
jgi:hypothetical protein